MKQAEDKITGMPTHETTALIVFGTDESGKPHASVFALSDLEPAKKAASLMGMQAYELKTDDERAVAAQLPRGRLFTGSGKAFVPFVASGLYERLCAMAEVSATSIPIAPENECPGAASPDEGTVVAAAGNDALGDTLMNDQTPVTDWTAHLVPGSIVLALEEDNGFYEASVVRIDGDYLTLKWFGYKLPAFKRTRWQVGKLPERKPYW